MSKRNVYLVDLGTGSNRNLLPLGIGLISSYAKSLPHLDEAFRFHIHFLRGDPDEIAASFDGPAVVALACYVWNLKASLRLAEAVKRRWPNALIVAGGYSIPRAPERVTRFFADNPSIGVLVHGEGELTFADLLGNLDGDLSGVSGITYRDGSGFVTTPRRDRIADLNVIPSPFLNGTFDELMARYGDKVTGVVWETNRGCPYSCTFCDWGDSSVTKVKQFALDRLDAEIEWIARNKVGYIYLADANFGIFYDRDLDLAGRIADRAMKTGYPKFMAINWLKNSHEKIVHIADALARGGVQTSITLAVQSFHKPVLEAIKRKNVNTDALKKVLRDRGMATYTEMILGLPGETYGTFLYGLNQAMSSPFLSDHWVFHLCTLLENTEMDSAGYRERYGIEGRIINAGIARRAYSEGDEQETEEIVVGTASMPTPDWREAYMVGYLSAVLYNFRAAYFLMQYVQRELGTEHTDFIEFVLGEVEKAPERFPTLRRGVEHLRRQQQMILDGVACLSPVPELGGNLALPHEAVLAILLDDTFGLYDDLAQMTRAFLDKHGVGIEPSLLADLIVYQHARMPVWRPNASHLYRFHHNVPEYFDAITKGAEPPLIRKVRSQMTVVIPEVTAKDKFQFAAQRTRSGHTIALHRVDLPKPARVWEPAHATA